MYSYCPYDWSGGCTDWLQHRVLKLVGPGKVLGYVATSYSTIGCDRPK